MNEILELSPPTSTPTEWSEVERPLLLQLAGGQATAGLRRVEASMQSRQLIITFRKPAGLAARLSERLQQLDAQDIFQPVSYTHLTLPTN